MRVFDRSSDKRTFVQKKKYVNFPLDNILSNHFSTFLSCANFVPVSGGLRFHTKFSQICEIFVRNFHTYVRNSYEFFTRVTNSFV